MGCETKGPHRYARQNNNKQWRLCLLAIYRELHMPYKNTTSVGTGTIDESPMAYKDSKEILQLIADTVEVDYFIKPVINLKATCSYDSSVEIGMNEEQD